MEIIKHRIGRLADQLDNITLFLKKRPEEKHRKGSETKEAGVLSVPALTATNRAMRLPIAIEIRGGKHYTGDATDTDMQK